nr:hypothetical protein [Tanacetum cinerariifolium]
MGIDIWEIIEKLAERLKLIKVRSWDYSTQNNSMAEAQFVKDSTKPMTAIKSSKDGESKDDLVLKLIDDLDEALIVIESDGMVKKNEIYVAPVAIAPVE